MTEYIFAYVLIIFAAIVSHGKTWDARRKNKCIALFFIIFLLFALRHPYMGIDLGYGLSTGYLANYNRIANFSIIEALTKKVMNYEQGYILFNKLLSIFSKNQQFLLVGCAAVTIAPIVYLLYKRSYNLMLSLFVFMGLPSFLLLFSGIRQSIAMGICFLSMLYIEEKKSIKFVLFVLLAGTFHSSAMLFLAAYPLFYLSVDRNWRIASIAVPPIFFILRYPLFLFLSRLIRPDATIDNNNSVTLFLIFLLIYAYCTVFSSEETTIRGYKNLCFAACCIQALAGVNSVVMRVGYYYMNSMIILLPMVTGKMKNRKNAWILNLGIGACFVLFGLYSLRNGSWSRSYPYRFFWE